MLPTPFPFSIPVKVVDPVPPRRTASVLEAETSPFPSTTKEPLVSPVRYVFPVTVNAVVLAYSNTEVEEAVKEYGEPLNQSWVVVELASCPKLVVGVHAKAAPEPVESVPQ